jgi:hypothetical protein
VLDSATLTNEVMMMVKQGALPFKLEGTDDLLTAQAGLVLGHEFHLSLGVGDLLEEHLPAPGSNRGLRASEVVLPTVLMLQGGGRDLSDIGVIAQDKALRRAAGLKKVPAPSTLGDWLRRTGSSRRAMRGLLKVGRALAARRMEGCGSREFTLDVDATIIEANKRDAEVAYEGTRGYQPMLGFLFETRWLIHEQMRAANVPAQSGAVDFIRSCQGQMPREARIARLRSDSAFYRRDVVEVCEREGIEYVIRADWDEAVKAAYRGLGADAWEPHVSGRTKRQRQVAQTVHAFDKGGGPFRLIFVRDVEAQQQLFGTELTPRTGAIITNAPAEEMTAQEVVEWYNQRGTAENYIKELKVGFGMERMPCGEQEANAAWLRIGALAYNLFLLQQAEALPQELGSSTVQTVRWRFYAVAARLVRHARALVLKVAGGARLLGQMERMRAHSWQMAYG